MRGTVKKLVADRGFGFLTPEGGNKDLFFHATAVQNAKFEELSLNMKVEYDEEYDSRRGQNRATNVKPA